MPPSHILKPITDQAGNLLQQSVVRLYEAGTTDPITDPFFSDALLTQQVANPFNCLSGVIDIYFSAPHDIRIGVTPPNSTQEIIFDYISTMEAPSTGPGGTPVFYQTLRDASGSPLPQRSNMQFASTLQATDDAVNDTTLVAMAPEAPSFDATADPILIGSGAADNGPTPPTLGGVAIGDNANIGDGNAVAVGPGAAATMADSIAIGDSAGVAGTGTDGIAIGHLATVMGDRAVALGQASGANGASAAAVGDNSTANGPQATALGYNATVATAHTHSTAVGADAATDRANQVMLGTSADTPEVPGAGNGVVLHSPNGTRWKVTVDDTGHLTTTAL